MNASRELPIFNSAKSKLGIIIQSIAEKQHRNVNLEFVEKNYEPFMRVTTQS